MTINSIFLDTNFPAIANTSISSTRLLEENLRQNQEETSLYYLKKLDLFQELVNVFMESQNEDWDGYGGKPAESSALFYSNHFINQLSPDIPTPEFGVDTDGDIAIEWDLDPRRILSIRVSRDGTLNYAGLIGHKTFFGTETLSERIPKSISQGLERVFFAE
jgi:hypothetical protein